ncbi:glycosyltransferase [Polaribacter aestuariivivens]|uniref:Glycosyltransferase n=1 Tax=Polaribacter aestuariivivens TaxID=2304626 RepID=A0A5S3N3K8_9FLAO|nr:glycosyltransferase [Polaribacter aestuariivivens]TMM29911.1 glycosyltransferase [Polaribacter aestuariivivens]
MTHQKKVIVAPLNWGLGHASRCVPIIHALISENFVPIIASDGKALEFLQQEFPALESIILPSYKIKYGKKLKWSLLLQTPFIFRAIQQEKEIIHNFINSDKSVVGIISDNRFGVRNKKVTSVYITHQINVLSGFTTFFTSKIHQKIINKFDECWIPDTKHSTFSGKLSSSENTLNQKFVGLLSRFKKQETQNTIDVLVLLSGPEPNRTFLEEKLISIFKNDNRKIVFILGKVEKTQKKWIENNCTFYNYALSDKLQELLNSSKIVLCRSGYSSIMDLAILEKKVFFIPTKNQPEQEYLAKYLQQKKMAPFCEEHRFTLDKLKEIENYSGLKSMKKPFNKSLFSLFHGERKF